MPLVLASSNMMLRTPRFWGKQKSEDIAGVAGELKELKEAMVGFVKQSEIQMAEIKQQHVAKYPLTLATPNTVTPRTA